MELKKFIDNFSGETIKKYFVKNNHICKLHYESALLVPISSLSLTDNILEFKIQNWLL